MDAKPLTNSERAARCLLAINNFDKLDTASIAAIIRREIPGCDEINALRRRVAAMEQACKMTVAQWDDVCVPGAACEGCPEPDYVAACRAALSASPRAKADAASFSGDGKVNVTGDLTSEEYVHRLRGRDADANAEIVRRLVEWSRQPKQFGTELDDIIRDAAALRAEAGGKP